MKFMRSLLAGLVLVLVAASSFAQGGAETVRTNAIETVEVGKVAGSTVVKLGLRKEIAAVPSNFTISNPARIVFDFPGTENSVGHTTKVVNEGVLRGYSVVQAGDRSRLVLNLAQNARFEARVDGKQLYITLLDDVRSDVAVASPGVQHFAASVRNQENTIRDIQFRRNKEGAGVVRVEMTSGDVPIDVVQKGTKLYVSFKKTELPEAQRKRLDVVDFGTPVTAVTTRQEGDGVTMEITPTGLWEHTAYQSDNQFIVEVRPVKEDPSKLFQGSKKGYQGELISLNFQNIPLRELLHVFADITNFNIVVSDSVGGNVSLRLNDVPWDQALDIVLEQKNLAMRKSGNVIWIAPQDEFVARDKTAAEARNAAVTAEIPRLEAFQLNYQKAEDFAKLLEQDSMTAGSKGGDKAGGGFLSPIGRVTIDKRTNQVFVYDVPTKLSMIGELVAKIDRAPKQVLIEARMVEADKTFSKTLGARLGVHDLRGAQVGHRIFGGNNPRFAVGGSVLDPATHTGQDNATTDFLTQAMNVNLPAPAVGAATSQAGQFSLILFNSTRTEFLNLELSALEADRKGKIISSPRVVTANQVEALIEQGTEIPYLQASASGATNVAFKKAVLSLKVTPQITPDGRILMKILVTKDAPSTIPIPGTVGTQIAINTRKVETEVSVDNGGTVVIGGIFTQTNEDTVQKVPFFGDLPFIGSLFRQKTQNDQSRELLVFITPKIVNAAFAAMR